MSDNFESWSATVAPNTARAARNAIKLFEQFRAGRDITPELLMAFRASLCESGRKASTATLILAHLSGHLRREGMAIPPYQLRAACKPVPAMRHVPVVLTKAEIKRLWSACRGSNTGKAVRALLLLGARKAELLALTPDDVQQGHILIRGVKTHRERLFPKSLIGYPIKPPFIWHPPHWTAIKEAAGMPKLKPKDLRATAASYISSSGKIAPMVAAALLGHSLSVLEGRYFVPVFEITGETVMEWYGLAAPALL
jgi:integrase